MRKGALIIDVAGTSLSKADCTILEQPLVGGIILFSRNVESLSQLQKLVSEVRSVRQDLLICVDQEGGRVQRLHDGMTPLPAMAKLCGKRCQQARDWGWLLASEVLACGLDFSFTPVLDLEYGLSEVIGDRSIGRDPNQVAALAVAFIEGLHEAGMAATAKHFPGHGGVSADSHMTVPQDMRSYSSLMATDMQPFKQVIERGVEAVMPAYIVYPQIDENNTAVFSSLWLQDILRRRMHFNGLIISDAIDMLGAADAGNYEDRALAAFSAGCDVVLSCNNRAGTERVLNMMKAHQFQSLGSELRVMRAKKHYEFSDLYCLERWQETRKQLIEGL